MDIKIEKPFEGFPEHTLSIIAGLIFIIVGGYLITLVNFNKEPDVTIVWLFIGLLVIAGGSILGIIGFFGFFKKFSKN